MRGSGRSLVRLVAGAVVIVAAGCGPGTRISDVHLGEQVPTRQGNVVTLYGWTSASGTDRGGPGSRLALKSCRARRNGLVFDGSAFAVRTARGTVLLASGSRLTAVGADCVTGDLLFDVAAGDRPEFATYRAGAKLLRWRLVTGRA